MKFTLIQLLHAHRVASCGSFSEAARQCNVSQPTISNNVSELESIIGKKLFKRSTRKVELTPFGESLMPAIEDALNSSARVETEAKALIDPSQKLLRVAFTPLLDIGQVNALCAAYSRANPNVEVVFKECEQDSLEDRLFSEQIDLACGTLISKVSEFRRCHIFKDQLRYVPPEDSQVGLSRVISLEEIAQTTLLLSVGLCGLAPATIRLFETAQIEIQVYAGRALTHSTLQEWAELGLGGAILPTSKIKGDAERYPCVHFQGNKLELELDAVWLKSSETTPHLKGFYDSLSKVAPAIFKEVSVLSHQRP